MSCMTFGHVKTQLFSVRNAWASQCPFAWWRNILIADVCVKHLGEEMSNIVVLRFKKTQAICPAAHNLNQKNLFMRI